MSQERKKVLELLAAGKISADDAERLLARLEAAGAPDVGDEQSETTDGRARYVRVDVDDPEESEKVRMRIPLGFLRNGLRLGTMLPERIRARLEAQGFQGLFFGIGEEEDLMKVLDALDIDVDEGDGRRVRIYCE